MKFLRKLRTRMKWCCAPCFTFRRKREVEGGGGLLLTQSDMCSVWYYKNKNQSVSASLLHANIQIYWSIISTISKTASVMFPCSLYFRFMRIFPASPSILYLVSPFHIISKLQQALLPLFQALMHHNEVWNKSHFLKPLKSLWKQPELSCKACRCCRLKPLKLDSFNTPFLLCVFLICSVMRDSPLQTWWMQLRLCMFPQGWRATAGGLKHMPAKEKKKNCSSLRQRQ